jgi:hypothetical protein
VVPTLFGMQPPLKRFHAHPGSAASWAILWNLLAGPMDLDGLIRFLPDAETTGWAKKLRYRNHPANSDGDKDGAPEMPEHCQLNAQQSGRSR